MAMVSLFTFVVCTQVLSCNFYKAEGFFLQCSVLKGLNWFDSVRWEHKEHLVLKLLHSRPIFDSSHSVHRSVMVSTSLLMINYSQRMCVQASAWK